jgi:hypothetical protein
MYVLWGGIKIIGPVVLTVMGIVMAIWKPKPDAGTGRWYWIASFVLVGSLTAYAGLQSAALDKAQLVELITGGDNYCFVRVEEDDLRGGGENLPLWIEATGNLYEVSYWMFPASARRNRNDPGYWSLDKPKPPMGIVYKGAVLLGRTVSPGHYMIEFSAKNTSFLQSLNIVQFNGALIQLIDVIKMQTGEPVYRSPRPAGYMG